MIKARTEKMGTETMIKGFVWGMTPSDMLLLRWGVDVAECEEYEEPDDE